MRDKIINGKYIWGLLETGRKSKWRAYEKQAD